ncbi:polycystin-1-like isoform X1 [Brachionus plicatilis]|uniref:Polycystin-1-like isoform X1 n=1 Tax=Brachionus plicatilis TaxID=10195 RepID=A0A3M7T9R6_BRAPC|nr:polycystin-1-like isoform X1 [Brachionus plicatilis]
MVIYNNLTNLKIFTSGINIYKSLHITAILVNNINSVTSSRKAGSIQTSVIILITIFYDKYANLTSTVVPLGMNRNGKFKVKLPEGSKEKNYFLKITIQIVNDLGAVTNYEIPKEIFVIQKPGFVSEFKSQILDSSTSQSMLNSYFENDPLETSKNLLSLTFMIYSDIDFDLNETNSTNSTNSSLPGDANIQIKSLFIQVASDLPVNDLRSIQTTSLVLSKLTENSEQISFEAASMAIDKNQQLTDSISIYKEKTSFGQLKSASDRIIDSAASSLIALSQGNSNDTTNKSIEGLNSVSQMFNKLLNVSSDHLGFNQESEVKTKNVNLKFIKSSMDGIKKNINLDNGQFKLPNLTKCQNEKCNSDKILLQSFSVPKPILGTNGDQLKLSGSSLVSLSLFDESSQQLSMNSSENFFQIRIKKDSSQISPDFQMVQTNNLSNQFEKIVWFSFNVSNPRSSIHVQIKPENDSKAILALLKFNEDPSFKEKIFDLFEIFCPRHLKEYNDSMFYQFFVNMSTTASYLSSSHVGVVFRQLTEIEFNEYCLKNTTTNLPTNLNDQNPDSNMSAFSFRVFTAGCYFIDKETGEWSANVYSKWNETSTNYFNLNSFYLFKQQDSIFFSITKL